MMGSSPQKTPRTARADAAATLREVVNRDISQVVQCMLWGRAAGRCEFAGCNKPLWKSSVTQEVVNVAQKAHIYAFSVAGPRGNRGISRRKINSLENLLLVCHECHRKIDRTRDGGRYTVGLLRGMKGTHEQRVEQVTGIAPDKKSHILLYGANIGVHSSPLNYGDAAKALFPDHYPATDVPIELHTINSSFVDRDAEFWHIEAENLKRKYASGVRERLAVGEIEHLSVFGLAPQPLLVLLGSMLGDIVSAESYQRHREPRASWQWPRRAVTQRFIEKSPSSFEGKPALVLALSATVAPDRVTSILGSDTSIWTVIVPRPHNDLIKSRRQLSQLRSLLRSLIDRIKAAHGQNTVLHVFPVASNSASIELGRVRMPKADMPWQLYDQINEQGGFIPALLIGNGV
jgi:hypothetical protein